MFTKIKEIYDDIKKIKQGIEDQKQDIIDKSEPEIQGRGYGSPLVADLADMNPDSILEYDKSLPPFFPEGKAKYDLDPELRKKDYAQLQKEFDGSVFGPFEKTSYGDLVDKYYLGRVGGKTFAKEQQQAYKQAEKAGQVPTDPKRGAYSYKNRYEIFPIGLTTQMSHAIPDTRANINISQAVAGTDLDSGLSRSEKLGQWGLNALIGGSRKTRDYNALNKKWRAWLDYHNVLMHELGHLATFHPEGPRMFNPWRKFQSAYPFDRSEEFNTMLLNGMNASRLMTGEKLNTPGEVSRLLDEIEANPKLLKHYENKADGGRIFRAYLYAVKKNPKIKNDLKKAMARLGSLIADTGNQGPSMRQQYDPGTYQRRLPFNFNPYYSTTS